MQLYLIRNIPQRALQVWRRPALASLPPLDCRGVYLWLLPTGERLRKPCLRESVAFTESADVCRSILNAGAVRVVHGLPSICKVVCRRQSPLFGCRLGGIGRMAQPASDIYGG